MSKGVQVFVSYRREGGRDIARNVSERLLLRGFNTFFDYDSLRDGKFNDQIYEAIDQCDDFILILSEHALDRCVNADDWVRCEIEYAISKGKHIILLAVEGFIDFPENLPIELSELRTIQYHYLDNRFYDDCFRRLIRDLYVLRTRRRFIKILMLSVVVLFLGTIILWGFLVPEKGNHVTAEVSLLRVPEVEMLLECKVGDYFEDTYSYVAYYDSIGQVLVKPVSNIISFDVQKPIIACTSPVVPMVYHNPIFKLVLKNPGNMTQILDQAEICISDMRVVDEPYLRFFYDGEKLFVDELSGSSLGILKFCYEIWDKDGEVCNIMDTLMLSSSQPSKMSFAEDEIVYGTLYQSREKKITEVYLTSENNGFMTSFLDAREKINLYSVSVSGETYRLPLKDFLRELLPGEYDDGCVFAVECDRSCEFKMSLNLKTAQGEHIETDVCRIRYFRPVSGIRSSFYVM